MDDGARTLEDSAAMARMAIEHGTTDLVCTPHANLEYKYDPELIRQRLAEVQQAAGGELHVYAGCDFHLSYDNIQDAIANPRKYTLDQKSYLLVEFSEMLIFNNTADIFLRLLDAGMVPIITHPERNGLLRQRIDQIAAWVDDGTRVQVTGQSLTGKFGRRAQEFSRMLLDRNLVHFIASDAHDTEHRPPRMDQAYSWLKKEYSEELAEALCITNPRAAVRGEGFYVARSEVAPSSRKWYQIWR
jgi:protein-tyrosine phosphatase